MTEPMREQLPEPALSPLETRERAVAMIADGFSDEEIEFTTGLPQSQIVELRRFHKSKRHPFFY